uniref:DNA topoisomerase 1 n=1 Tax=Marseillevirus LCMAC202 TaxID=2506606 RepID=A0A481YY03_9VIRU|nr:MAG: DNA topoisomerase I [Marseillevirus LCMAC202]
MNQYCYDIITDLTQLDATKLKKYVRELYQKKKFKDLAFPADEKLPYIVLYSKKAKQVCIKMTSKAKKNIERIEGIHFKLKPADLKFTEDIVLDKPYIFELEQCAWWDEDCKIAKGQKWSTLVHNGPYFTHLVEPYEPHGAPIVYTNVEYDLTPQEERIANFYARRIISEKSGNVTQLWTKDKVFNKNFWTDFKKYLTAEHKKIFKDFSKLDFSQIIERLEELKEIEKQMTQKEKDAKKIKAAERKQDYGYAIINDIKEPVGNFTIEPAAIFYGRGNNPKRGKIKRDIDPEEVIINIDEKAKVPVAPAGHNWKQVIHDHNAAWIASWKDPISNESKYVYLGAEGQLKGRSDFVKYEKARKLNKYLNKIRKQYTADITSHLNKSRQLGTVLYLIDRHGIRVGNEKDESETDTVGASTLRVEHVKLKDPNIVIFDFLGKDSVRYYKEIPVEKDVYDNFVEFLGSKKPSDPVFDLISATDINSYLKTFDKDFSAKVFRTRLASTVMDAALKKSKVKKKATQDDKKKIFTKANIEVAKILNHQRTVSAKAKETVKKYQTELKELRAQLKAAKEEGKSTVSLERRVQKKKDLIAAKKDTLNIAISTSLTNYIDPRIVVSWSKTNEMNIPKAYTATLQRKFKWAIDMTEKDWDYTDTELLPEMAILQPLEIVKKAVPTPTPTPVPLPTPTPTQVQPGKVSKKKLTQVEGVLQIAMSEDIPPPVKKPTTYQQSEFYSPIPGVSIIDYSAKSIAVVGNTKDLKEYLKATGGKFNKKLTVDKVNVPGWIFSKNKLKEIQDVLSEAGQVFEVGQDVQELLEELESPPAQEKTWDDIMAEHELTQKERNIIKCFGRDPNVVAFLKSELSGGDVNKKIYNIGFLAQFLACLDTYDQAKKIQQSTYKKYQKKSFELLAADVVSRLQPSSVPTFMFLIFILYKVSSRMKEQYLQQLVNHLTDVSGIQECLCDNSDQETIITVYPIKTVAMNELYLLPSGRCVHLDDLIMHLKTSGNKMLDPTYNKFQHGSKASVSWTSGWELRAMLDRIQDYNYAEGKAIKTEFQQVLKDIATEIPDKTKEFIKDTYVLFYFPETDNKEYLVDMLVKYGYPTGEAPGDKAAAELIVKQGSGDQLDEFRTLLGFKLGYHIMEELSDKAREAFLFAGEFAGMGKEAWGKLSMGEFCTKTFGSIMHRMSDLFDGKWGVYF